MTAREAYEEALAGCDLHVREPEPFSDNELFWQARWFSGACGREFVCRDGRKVLVTDFGEWNREAGPDFVNTSVRIDGKHRQGAIEVDLDAAGWEKHRHATNPDYENVVLHVAVRTPARVHFPRTASHREVPQICLSNCGGTDVESGAYVPAKPGRCAAPLRLLSQDSLADLLAVAARRRLERKGLALAAMIEARGTDAALYESFATALGYKNNKLPFQLLAQRVPPRIAATPRGEALLFGLAGFLEKPQPPSADARNVHADLWKSWWRQRSSHAHLVLPRSAWRMNGLRPANHPLRRLGALVSVARCWKTVRGAIESGDLEQLEKVLGALKHPFWSFHTTWNSPRRATTLALVGPERIRDIYVNIALPLALSRGAEPQWLGLPASAGNTPARVAAARLFGGPPPRTLAGRLYVQQGLLQIYSDFCQRDHDECARCRFPGIVEKLSA